MRLSNWFQAVPLRLRSLFRRSQVEQELDEELRYHLERQIEEDIAKGLTPEEARRAALLAMGGVEQQKEVCRDMRRVNLIENTWQDLRYAGRSLRRNPGFTAVAILSLAFGIGANTAIFQLLNALRLRSLPVTRPQELAEVLVAGGNRGLGIQRGINSELTNPLWERIRENQRGFSQIFAWGNAEFVIGSGAERRPVEGLFVSGDLFPTLGVRPARGRLFTPGDDRRGCGTSGVVLSYGFWQNYFGGEESAIGKAIKLGDKTFTVIGVTPPEFFGLEIGKRFDVATPICTRAGALDRLDFFWLVVMGRLKPDWTLAQASAQLNAISPGVFEATAPGGYDAAWVNRYRNFRLTAIPAGHGVSRFRASYGRSLWLLLGMTGLVLLIACTNLANLLLARANAREREIAVRVAIGASRGRLIRQMLSESLLLAGAGSSLGLLIAGVVSRSLISYLSVKNNSIELDLGTDWRVLAFTTAVAIGTCLLFGLAPALRASQIKPVAAMKSSGVSSTNQARFSFQRLFVVGQIAISLLLLVGALLFARSFLNLTTLDPGFRKKDILFASVDFARLRLPVARVLPFQTTLLDQIRSIPRVESVASSSITPFGEGLSQGGWTQEVRVQDPQGEQRGFPKFTYVSPEYFKTMEIPFLTGRDFNGFDTANSRKVALINEAFIRRYLPNSQPIGAIIRTIAEPNYPETEYEVVGVVKDTKYASLRDEMHPITYVPATQHPAYGPWSSLVIRSKAPLAETMAQIKLKLQELHPEISVELKVFETRIRESLVHDRLIAFLAGLFGVVAVQLAIIGLYGVISYMVLRRRNEIGIRMALGAQRKDVIGLVLRETMRLAVIGVIIGLGASLGGARLIASLLYGLTPNDPVSIVLSSLLLLITAALAGYLPARRSARIDPMAALRHD